MKKRRFLLAVLALAASGYSETHEEAIRELGDSLRSRPVTEVDPNSIPSDKRDAVLAYIRSSAGPDKRDLLRLRDQVTIDAVIQKFAATDGKDRFARQGMDMSCAPWIIPELERFLVKDRAPNPRSWAYDFGRSSDLGVSHTSALIMQKILISAPEIPEATKAWARSISRPPARFLEDMRTWWQQNKQRFAEDRYAEVKPWEETNAAVTPIKSQPEMMPVNPPGTSLPPVTTPPVAPLPAQDVSPPQPSSAHLPGSEPAPSRTVWIVLGGIGAALAAVVIYLRRPGRG